MTTSVEEPSYPERSKAHNHDDIEGKIFVGGLSWQTTEASLRYYFEKFGELTDAAIMVDKRTGQPRGFGFITMKDPAAAEIVVSTEHTIDGRTVDVKKAVPRDMAPAPSRSEARKIFVGGLPAEATEKDFAEYFSKFGTVKDAVVMVDRTTGRSRGFGFITFENEDSVEMVLQVKNEILGKWVEIKRAEPRDSRDNSRMAAQIAYGQAMLYGGGRAELNRGAVYGFGNRNYGGSFGSREFDSLLPGASTSFSNQYMSHSVGRPIGGGGVGRYPTSSLAGYPGLPSHGIHTTPSMGVPGMAPYAREGTGPSSFYPSYAGSGYQHYGAAHPNAHLGASFAGPSFRETNSVRPMEEAVAAATVGMSHGYHTTSIPSTGVHFGQTSSYNSSSGFNAAAGYGQFAGAMHRDAPRGVGGRADGQYRPYA